MVSLVTYALHGWVDGMLGISLAIGGLFGVGWGVRMAHALPERALVLLFCGLMSCFCCSTNAAGTARRESRQLL